LLVWQRAYALADQVISLAEVGPLRKQWYFRNQMCDAAMSVPANVAEGNGRSTPRDYASFVDRARGSLFELDTWLFTAHGRGWLSPDVYSKLEGDIEELSAMLLGLANRLRAKSDLPSRKQGPP